MTFEYLEFDNELFKDFKMRVKQHTDVDCFVCVVIYHGSQDKIRASDNIRDGFEEIVMILDAMDHILLP
jgi:hypothetical protein